MLLVFCFSSFLFCLFFFNSCDLQRFKIGGVKHGPKLNVKQSTGKTKKREVGVLLLHNKKFSVWAQTFDLSGAV